MSVFYKFKSSLAHDTIQFDDLHISLQDFKKAVISQKQFGKNTNFDLQVTNAETNEVYSEENSLIPKNSSLIVVRVPIAGSQKKAWDGGEQLGSKIGVLSSDLLQENAGNVVFKSADLVALNASEDDKIQAMMMQSTMEYDSSNYLKVKGGSQFGDPPPNYVCHKCQHTGHWIKDCPITIVPDIKKSSGIPQSFMTPVEGPSVPGALMTPTGTFAVPTIDLHAYKEGKKEKPFIPSEETEEESKPIIPEDLTCSLCQDLLTDAVMMPCCGNSFCDDCIRNMLIETEENQCPDCSEKDISPETLIPNRFLRNAVNNFRNKTGYRGGGQRNKHSEAQPEPSKSPAIENDDVEIIATIPTEVVVTKEENEPEKEMGSAIAVLGSSGPQSSSLHRSMRLPTNGTQNKMPNIHLEHRPPMGRPPKHLQNENSNGGGDSQRGLINNGIKQETVIDVEKPSPPLVPHVPPPALPDRNRLSGPPPPINQTPNSAAVPGGYNPQTMPPMGAPSYPTGVPPMMPNYGHPPGVNPMVMPPQHMGNQASVRMYPYPGQTMYNPQMNDRSFRSGPNRGMRMQHGDGYQDRNNSNNNNNNRNIVEDPLEAFERHLREREKQDRMRRNRARRTRSRSHSRGKTRSISRSRSRSRSPLKKRSHTKTPPSMRKESPSMKREFRSPIGVNRSRSKSRSRTRLRSCSRSPIPRSGSISPNNALKKKRSVSLSPSAIKKHSCSPSLKKSLRMNRSRSRSRTRSRSKSIARSRKRRRSRTRSRSISSRRSFSRGRSYSRSLSPRSRRYYSPNRTSHHAKRSRSPRQHSSRYRSSNSNYKDGSPFVPGSYHDSNDYRGHSRRGGRNQRFHRGGGRYSNNSNQNYDYGNKYDRYTNERYDDKRYVDNQKQYYNPNDHSRNRKDTYYQAPIETYNQYQDLYSEVAPPGTTEPLPSLGYHASLSYDDSSDMYNVARNEKYRSPEYLAQDTAYQSQNLKPVMEEDWTKSSKDRDRDLDHYRRKSREKYHYSETDRERKLDGRSETDRDRRHGSRSEVDRDRRHDSRSEVDRDRKHDTRSDVDRDRKHDTRSDVDRDRKHDSRSEIDRERRHDSRSRYASSSPSRNEKKHRSHGHSTDKDKSRVERSSKGNSVEKHAEYDRISDSKLETSPDKEKSRKDDDKKDDHKEKKDKSKRKKKKDSDADKKKKKKLKTKKDEDHKIVEETRSNVEDKQPNDEPVNEKVLELDTKETDLYDGMEDTKVDKTIIENYIQTDKPEEHLGEKRHENIALAPVPELSKWERDEDISSDDTKMLISDSSYDYSDSKKVVTDEILKRAENVLFQKAAKIPTKSNDLKADTYKDNDDLILPENPREARKSGNSLQITVPVSSGKSEDESKISACGRISAKDRLGAKVDDKYSGIRSLVEPKKPSPALKSVVDVKHSSSKTDSHHKTEKHDDSKSRKHEDKKHSEDKKRKENRHGDSKHHSSKHRESKESKEKKRRKSSDDEIKPKKDNEEKRSHEKELPCKEPFAENNNTNVVEPKNTDGSINDVKTMLEKKRPSLDEASFEPDYDLTSESEEEGETKSIDEEKPKRSGSEPVKEIKSNIDKELIKKLIEHTRQSSSETTSDSSTDSSIERKKHKKKKTKKRKKAKKRRNYSSDSDTDESSDSDSDSDTKHKRKKKHKHKNKKTSRIAKKKKKSKHRS